MIGERSPPEVARCTTSIYVDSVELFRTLLYHRPRLNDRKQPHVDIRRLLRFIYTVNRANRQLQSAAWRHVRLVVREWH